MLLSIFFNDGTTVAEVEALVHSYSFESLQASRRRQGRSGRHAAHVRGGWRDAVAVPDDNDAALFVLDIWRVAEGMGDIAPVIRNSSAEDGRPHHQNDGGRLYKRHYKRPFGSGEGMGWNPGKE